MSAVPRVYAAPLQRHVSALGFGCASLGSRHSPARGLRALAAAFEAGVDWFDVAPSYGDGQAEAILGKFIAGRRHEAMIATKVGIKPPRLSPAKRVLKPLVRALLQARPSLRTAIAGRRPAAAREPLDAEMIERSLAQSCAALGTDFVDVLMLHEPSMADVQRDEVLRMLETVRGRGQALAVGVAGDTEVIDAAMAMSEVFGVAQLAYDPLTWSPAAGRFRVVHGVLGAAGPLQALTQRIAVDPQLREALEALAIVGTPADMAARALQMRAMAANRDGVVLVSMFGPRHLTASLESIARRELGDRVAAALYGSAGGSA